MRRAWNSRLRWAAAAFAAAALAALCAPGAATAHVEVSPSVAAPGDGVRFTVLVPGERDPIETTRIEMKIPDGVLPYSFADTPGWERTEVKAKDQSIDRVVWTGRLDGNGFVEFSFLAATPDEPGTTLTWPALQTYADGQVSSWIGPPDSESPAATTVLDPEAAPENAGGEGTGESATTATPDVNSDADNDVGGTDWVARGIALAALVGLIALVATAGRRKKENS